MKKLFILSLFVIISPMQAMDNDTASSAGESAASTSTYQTLRGSALQGLHSGVMSGISAVCTAAIIGLAPKIMNLAINYCCGETPSNASQSTDEQKELISRHLEVANNLSRLIQSTCEEKDLSSEQHEECSKLRTQMLSLLQSLSSLELQTINTNSKQC